jgi:hypothetical protein
MFKDDCDPGVRLEVLEAYEYIRVLKERAAIAVRLLIAGLELPHEICCNDYDLGKISKLT